MYKCTVAEFGGIFISPAGFPITAGWSINSVIIPEQQHLDSVMEMQLIFSFSLGTGSEHMFFCSLGTE